jgi:hypothetical protein
VSYDAEQMAAIAEELYEFHVERAYGAVGVQRLHDVLATAKQIFLFRSPQSFSDGLIVFSELEAGSQLIERAGSTVLRSPSEVERLSKGAIVEVDRNRRLRAWPAGTVTAAELCDAAVVYVFDAARDLEATSEEAIELPEGRTGVPNPNGYPSALAPPTFWNLEDALDYYASDLAARSTCKLLKQVWAPESKPRRLVLCNKPERLLRESLAQHLRSSVRDMKLIEVLEEEKVSETKPVDIKVAWSLTSHVALIEVKWMGKCLHEDGDRLASRSYSDARARAGVEQLAGYLDEAHERSPNHEIKGYLVVFDARRGGVSSWEPGTVSKEDAWRYRDVEIDFKDCLPRREDLAPPKRVFLEPRIAA